MTEKKVILLLGKRGSGKSYLARDMLKNYNRYLVFDTIGEYSNQGVCFQDLKELGEFWEKFIDKKFRLIYQPLNPYKIIEAETGKTEFDLICDLVWECEDMALIVEEMDAFCGSAGISDSFANIVQRGRHRNITLIGISQRPYGISRLISSQAKEIYSFIMTEPRDIEYLSQYIGKDVDKIRDLKEFNYYKWDAVKGISIGKAGGSPATTKQTPKEIDKPEKIPPEKNAV